MPKNGEEIYLDEVELDLMRAFVKHKIFDDETCAIVLKTLSKKLEAAHE